MFELMKAAEYELEKKLNFINIVKIFYQFRLMTKLIFNESQCFMLQNRDLQLITDPKRYTENYESIIEEKIKKKKEKLKDYLIKKIREKGLSSIDKLLYQYLNREVIEELELEL